jgi:hypothetical protein
MAALAQRPWSWSGAGKTDCGIVTSRQRRVMPGGRERASGLSLPHCIGSAGIAKT